MPARFRISYENRAERPLDGREMFFDDEAEARAWYRDDIASPDPEVRAVGLWAIGDIDDHLLDCDAGWWLLVRHLDQSRLNSQPVLLTRLAGLVPRR